MIYKSVKKLSRTEEVAILREVAENGMYIDRGSSRAVFTYGKDKVVKIAADNQGCRQNRIEASFYERHPHACAEVYAIGSHIIICEKVLIDEVEEDLDTMSRIINLAWNGEDYSDREYTEYLDSEDFAHIGHQFNNGDLDELLNECGIDVDELAGDFGTYIDTLDTATYCLGGTLDNEQIGFSAHRQAYVLYDAGFDCDKCCDKCGLVGNVEDFLFETDDKVDFIDTVIRMASRNRMSLYSRKIAC